MAGSRMPQETKYKKEYPGILRESKREQKAVVSKATVLQQHLSSFPQESSERPVGKQAAGPDIHDTPFETRQEGTDGDNRESKIGKKKMSDEREEKMKEVRKADQKKDEKEDKKEVGSVEDEKKEEVMKTQGHQGRTKDEKKKEVEKTQGKQVDVRDEKKNGGECHNGAKDVKNLQNKENERFSQKENKEDEKKSGQVKIGNKEGETKDKDEIGVRNIMNFMCCSLLLCLSLFLLLHLFRGYIY